MPSQEELFSAASALIDPLQLQRFLSVFELGNFARAADATNITQQAMSKSIARLEEHLGVKLFERGAYGAEPTEYGKALARRAKIIVMESRLAKAELSALKGASEGAVRIGFGWSFLPRIAPLVINRFRKRRPNVALSIVSGPSVTLLKQLAAGEVEFVASAPPSSVKIDDAFESTELFQDADAIVMRADHPLARKTEITLEDLAAQTWLISLTIHEQWRDVTSVFVAAGIPPPDNIIDLDSLILSKAMIAKSDCVALLGREQMSPEIERGEFKTLEGTAFTPVRPACFFTRRNSVSQAAANAFKSDLFEVCRQIYT